MGKLSVDQLLVQRVQQGDKNAFNLLVQKYQQKINSLVLQFVKNQSDAMDITQEVFIKAYRSLANFRGDSEFYTWLYRIAANTAKNFLSSGQRRFDRDKVDIENAEISTGHQFHENATPESNVYRDELAQLISRTVQKLPDELRVALMLREIEGLSYEAIAGVMDCPVGTVRSRIFRARETIDKLVKPHMQAQG